MGFDDFAMVEELASLVRDNLPCKHLVLSVEEALVNFLECDTSVDGVLELQPMNSYNRLLLHRLADIFGFAHESVGEADERHLVLERCPETSIPSILVSDLLGQYDVQEEEVDEVEELASLVKDNLPCKHLVLSVEEALVKFLECDTRVNVDSNLILRETLAFTLELFTPQQIHLSVELDDGLLELQPMSSYNRHLLHRLANIFGFAHESVGEGDERHLVLKRRLLSSRPPILVSDLLRQYDVQETPTVFLDVLEKKKDDLPGPTPEIPKVELSLEDREVAYLAARQRIFSIGEGTSAEVKQRPQHNPVVARRMIAHALGKKVKPADHEACLANSDESGKQVKYVTQNDEQHLNSLGNKKGSGHRYSSSASSAVTSLDKSNSSYPSRTENNETKNNYREEHVGAAKRMFVNALGFHPRSANLPGSGRTK